MSLVNVHNDAYGADNTANCKFCGSKFIWKYSNYHRKDKPYELDGMRYHTCKNGGARVTVIKMSPEEMNREYGGPVSRRKQETIDSRRKKTVFY